MRAVLCLIVLLWTASPALADPTIISGKVTDLMGRPVANARVHVMSKTEHKTTQTDDQGRYAVEVDGDATYSVILAAGNLHTYRRGTVKRGTQERLDLDVETTEGEVIRILDDKPPTVPPKLTTDPRAAPPYSEQAMLRDAWAKAWLILDVTERGQVARVKFLKRPGFDLDDIAVKEAMKLRFEPALDERGRPMRTRILWAMEWPSHGWLTENGGTGLRLPPEAFAIDPFSKNLNTIGSASGPEPGGRGQVAASESLPGAANAGRGGSVDATIQGRDGIYASEKSFRTVPCAGSGPLNLDQRYPVYRDCSRPSLKRASIEPWFDGTTPVTPPPAVDVASNGSIIPIVPVHHSMIPELAATTVTAGLAVAAIVSYLKWTKYHDKVHAYAWNGVMLDEFRHDQVLVSRYLKLTFGFGIAASISGAMTAWLWTRDNGKSSFSVQPDTSGGSASYMRRF